ncbi:MAG: 30S ribosome-binding factor RbfA [Candidatus Portnoybacteria bacterium]|nr:30S ribosome-binding factor RbfA [Candidatus Portnoybacteria bacterium]
MSHRIEKVNELIRHELGRIILENEDFGTGVLVTIMDVAASDDLLHAKVVVSVFPSNKGERILEILNRHIFGLQQMLNKRLQMRPVPKIRFILDKSEQEAQHLSELMEK